MSGSGGDHERKGNPCDEVSHLNMLLRLSPAVIYTCEPTGDYPGTYVSESVVGMLGHEPADFLAPGFWAEHIHPDDRSRVFDELQTLFENGTHLYEYRFRHKDGSYRWMRDEMTLTRDALGDPVEIVGSWIDISQRKEAEVALEASERRYRSFVEHFHGIAYRGTLDFVPVFFHGDVEAITGYTEEEFTAGRPSWDQVILPADLDGALADGRKMRTIPGFAYEREYRILSKGGQIRWVQEHARNICDESGAPRFIEGVIYEVTDRKRIEQEREELIGELQKALARVRQLSGFLPICASCKKIRDDKGFWNQIESYIRDHSEVEFTHGICPECAERLYPRPGA